MNKLQTRNYREKEIKMRNAIQFIENDGKTDHLDSIKFEELITCLIITINNRMPKKCKHSSVALGPKMLTVKHISSLSRIGYL